MLPQMTACRPAPLVSTASLASCPSWPAPTLSTSAHATPSGYGSRESVTSARRSGMVYITPSTPPAAQMEKDTQNGKPVHHPTMISPGSTKMIAESVPAADATVCTMLFSWIVASWNARRIAMEITAAGIDVENVMPALRPK